MTTEDDFQKALDACPSDWQTRLVFADFLEERGDERAEGYRAMGVLGLYPRSSGWWWYCSDNRNDREHCDLPSDWFRKVKMRGKSRHFAPCANKRPKGAERRESEDAVARAFAKLPAERRAALLAQEALL